jgi:phage repressor protein C with HTH and peptisase S24 domain
MEPFERLKQARIAAGFATASDAAAALGISRATYIGHENGQRGLRPAAAEKYGRRFGVRAGWLLTGEQPMSSRLLRPEPERIPLEQWDPAAPEPYPTEDAPFVHGQEFRGRLEGSRPEIDVRAGAGQGQTGETALLHIAAGETVTGHVVINEWVLPESFYRHELHASQSNSLIMAVIGDSMAPTLFSGDRVIVDLHQAAFGADGIYVFHDGDGAPRVKRLAKVLFSDPPQVEIISDNPLHPPQTAHLAEVMIFGRVVGRITKM